MIESHVTAGAGASMLDDSVGTLTKSVYQASAATDHTLGTLFGKLETLLRKSNIFSSTLVNQQHDLETTLAHSRSALDRALLISKRIVNGMSDKEAAIVLNKMVSSLLEASKSVISAIEKKNLLRISLESQGREIGTLGKEVQAETRKSYSVLSVADKICENSKMLQEMSNSAVERAERSHLAKAASAFQEGVSTISKLIKMEDKLVEGKIFDPKETIPKSVDAKLEDAFTSLRNALDHTQNALGMTGHARAREVVDVRDQIRSGVDSVSAASSSARQVTGLKIRTSIVPHLAKMNLVINSEIVPTMKKYNGINDRILGFVDPTHAHDIQSRLSRQVSSATKSAFTQPLLLPLVRRNLGCSFL